MGITRFGSPSSLTGWCTANDLHLVDLLGGYPKGPAYRARRMAFGIVGPLVVGDFRVRSRLPPTSSGTTVQGDDQHMVSAVMDERTKPSNTEINHDEEITHIVCDICYPSETHLIALCGLDVTDTLMVPEDQWDMTDDCIVCVDLQRSHNKLHKDALWS